MQTAREYEVDLIILGSESQSGLKGILVGKTCEDVVRHADISVWIEREGEIREIRNILIPTDMSESSRDAVVTGLEWAKKMDAKATLLHVVDTPFTPSFSFVEPGDYNNSIMEVGRARFSDFCDALPGFESIFESVLSLGDPVVEIQRVSEENNIDCIILGSRGSSPFGEKVLGSVAWKVLRHAKVPIMVHRK